MQETLSWTEHVETEETLNCVKPVEAGMTDWLTFEEETGEGG